MEETPDTFLIPSTEWAHSEKRVAYEPGSEPPPDTKSTGALVLDFQL